MAKQPPSYSIGDMVVHRYYGIGKIESIDNKPFDGVKVDCFKVSTDNCVYWFPKDSLDNPRVHPVASQDMIEEAAEMANVLRMNRCVAKTNKSPMLAIRHNDSSR